MEIRQRGVGIFWSIPVISEDVKFLGIEEKTSKNRKNA